MANNPLSDLASDPALVGYYCTLPDEDDDDAPYTPRAALLPERTKVTVNTPVTPELEASYRQIPDGAPARLSSEGPSTETISSAFTSPLSACLPTPVPTPTACETARPALAEGVPATPAAAPTPPPSQAPSQEPACVLRRPREKNPSPELSEKEHDLLEEFNINLELSASEKREVSELLLLEFYRTVLMASTHMLLNPKHHIFGNCLLCKFSSDNSLLSQPQFYSSWFYN